MAVKIDESKCTGCGICTDVCPVNAITVDQVAEIDAETCTDCGLCVAECPNEALSMEGIGTVQSSQNFSILPSSQIPKIRDETIPSPTWASDGQTGLKRVNLGGLLGQIFDLFAGSTGKGRGRGKGRGGRGGRGRGRQNW